MLDRDNNHNGSCEFASEIVDYMYGEIAESGRNTFDAHLPGCESCTAELAGISSARLSVMEWRAAEFDSLQTPAIVIPYDKVERDSEQGWLASLRGLFASSPGRAAMAAIVPISVVCLGVALFTFDLFGPVEVARQDNSSSNTPTRKSNSGVSNPQTPPEVAASKPIQNKDITDESIKDPAATSVKAAERTAPKTRKAKTVSADTPAKVVDQTQPPTQRRRAPRLNNFDDEEDDSLRLADLFAQTDTED